MAMRLIVCDEHELAVTSLRRLFEGRGHEVVATAHQLTELPSLVERHRPDICMLDVVCGDGVAAAACARSIAACAEMTDVVVITADDRGQAGMAAMAAGASAVVSKRAACDELVDLVVGRTSTPRAALRSRSAGGYFLTERELQVLESLADGESTERIAARLNLRHATVRSHVQSVLFKMGVHSRAGAVAAAVRAGLITRCA